MTRACCRRPTRSVNQYSAGWTDEAAARFFDRVADGFSLKDAAASVGRTRQAGAAKFKRACASIGWQAS